MADMKNRTTSTSTQIRNFYSDGMSYMNVKFFNTNLSFQLYPFISKDATGKSSYDMQKGQLTTVNFEGASALQMIAKDILDGKITECNLPIPCAAGASINLERKMGPLGTMETIFSITKNGVTIPFKFTTLTIQVKDVNGQFVPKVIEHGLKAFERTIDGYLTGINADRHLDKLTDDFAKNQQGQNGQQNNGYNNGGYKKKPYTGANNYNKQYNNYNQNNQNNQNGWNPPRQQDMSSYQIKN